MGARWLLLLLLLLAGRGAGTGAGSGLCAREGAREGTRGCPQLRDGTDGQLCCSAWRLLACCPAGEAQLQGRRCPREAQTRQPQIQEEPKKPVDWKPLLMFVVLSTVLLLLWVAAYYYYCKSHFWPRGGLFLRSFRPDGQNQAFFPLNSPPPPSSSFFSQRPPFEDGQAGLAPPPSLCSDTSPTSPISPSLYDHQSPDLLGLPPPYHLVVPTLPPPPPPYNEDPPPYSLDDPRGNWDRPLPSPAPRPSSGNSGGEAHVGPLVPRSVSGCSSTSTLEADAWADEGHASQRTIFF